MKTVFVVDDNDVNLVKAKLSLDGHYRIFTLASAEKMFSMLDKITPDLILLDIKMPKTDGFAAIKQLKEHEQTANIPVIFLTAATDDVTEAQGFELGAVDFISKPFSVPVLLNRIKLQLDINEIIHERTEKLLRLQNSMVSVLAKMIENRDKLTGEHIGRTTGYIKILLNAMLEYNVYAGEIKDWDLEIVISSARLHDIGKIAVTDVILNKPGSLTADEFEIMKTHANEGEKIIDSIIAESGDEIFLRNAKLFAGHHHERWDGTGYPHKLKGEEIPLQGRIMAIADVYDALISERPYKRALPHNEAVEIIKKCSGTHFDPKIVDVFLKVNGLFEEVNLSR